MRKQQALSENASSFLKTLSITDHNAYNNIVINLLADNQAYPV